MKTNLKILAVFILFGATLFWPVFGGKVNLNGNLLVSFYSLYGQNLPYKQTGWDQLRIYFPFYQVTFEQVRQGIVPLWNPYAFSGHPHAADFQSAVFYPLNVFGLFLTLVDFWHLLRISPAILASFFTYLFLRNHRFVILETRRVDRILNGILSLRSRMTKKDRGLSILASFFGAVTFGFSPFILTWGEEVVMSPHSIVWMPLILWAIDKYVASSFRHSEPFASLRDKLREGSLLSIKRLLRFARNDKSGKYFLALVSVSTAFSLLGGYMQTSIYMFLFIGAYLLLQTGFKNLVLTRNGLLLIWSFVLGAGVSAIQLVPSAELFFNSARSQIALREKLYEFLLPSESLLTYLAPDFFGSPTRGNFFRPGSAQYYEGILFIGIAALVFATITMLSRKKDKFVWFLIAALIVSLLSTLDSPISRWFLTLPVPFLSTSIPNRILFIPAFCLAILGAVGLDLWIRGKIRIWGTLGFYATCYFLIIFTLLIIKFLGLSYFAHAAFKSPENILTTLRNLVIPLGVFGVSAFLIFFGEKLQRRHIAALLIIALALAQIFYFSQKYLTFSTRERIFPENDVLKFVANTQDYGRSWGVGQNNFANNFASYYGIYWPGGYDSLNNRSYGEFTYAMQGNEIADYSFRADAGLGEEGAVEMLEKPPNAQNRRTLMNMAGVKYLIGPNSESETLLRHNFNRVFQGNTVSVFENLEVLPRVILASNYEGPPPLADVTNMADVDIARERRKLIFKRLLDGAFDWRSVLILEKSSPISPQYGQGDARVADYRANEVVVYTASSQPKLLFLTDNYYPGWKAEVDGEETEILRANYTFRAVPLTAGEHKVRFFYDPMSFKVGLIISVLSLVGLGFLLNPIFIRTRTIALLRKNR